MIVSLIPNLWDSSLDSFEFRGPILSLLASTADALGQNSYHVHQMAVPLLLHVLDINVRLQK